MYNDYLSYLENESIAKDRNGFMYRFHEESIFDVERYQGFMKDVRLFSDHYSENKTDSRFKKLRARLIDVFEYILSSFYFHYRQNDSFQIKNIVELDDDFISDMFSEFRIITGELLRWE